MMNKKVHVLLLAVLSFFVFSAFANAKVISHTVVAGDTLWDICNHYVNDPLAWSTIWKENPTIKNPNLIHPGDVLTFKISKDNTIEGVSLKDKTGVEKQLMVYKRPATSSANSDAEQSFLLTAFLTKKEIEKAGILLSNSEGNATFLQGDTLYMSAGTGTFKTNTTYLIVRDRGELKTKNGDDDKVVGHRVEKVGTILITSALADRHFKGTLNSQYVEAATNDKVIPLIPAVDSRSLILQSTKETITGYIIGAADDKKALSIGDYAFIDFGNAKGLTLGNTLNIQTPIRANKKIIDWKTVGKAVVVDLYEASATIFIVDSSEEVSSNARVSTAK